MGNQFSSSNAVWLQTDKPAYYDGDVVQGLVCLNIVKPVKIASIDCQLTGVERTYWTETHETGTGSHRHSHTEHHGGTVQLLNVTHPLGGAGRAFEPGQYQWAIVFALPQGLPSSFRIGSGTTGAEVTYTVQLVFHTPGMFTSSIRSTQQLVVRQRLQLPAHTVDQSAEHDLVSCCCLRRGRVSAHVRLERDKCQPGEAVHVLLDIDNRSQLPIKGIELCLKREVLARESPSGTGGRYGHTHRWHSEFSNSQHQGVQPFTALQGSLARRMELRLPHDMAPSMHGALITCDQFVKVKLQMGFGVKDIKLKVPLIVLAPQPMPTPEEPFYFQPPPFWHPNEVQHPVGIDVPSAPPLPPSVLQPDSGFWAMSVSGGRGPTGAAAPVVAPAAAPAGPVTDGTTKYAVI